MNVGERSAGFCKRAEVILLWNAGDGGQKEGIKGHGKLPVESFNTKRKNRREN